MDLSYFRKNLKKHLKEQKLTLNALSIKADLSEDTLRSLIYGKSKDAKLSTLIKIADVLNCSVDHLVGHASYSVQEELIIRQLRTLSPRSLQTIQTLIDLEEKTTLTPSNKGKDIISILLPASNIKDGHFYDTSTYETLDITEYPDSLKSVTDFGIKILSSDLEPLYHINDILLLSRQHMPEYNDIVMYLDQDGKIYIRKYTESGLDPINKFGKKISRAEVHKYDPIGVVLKVVKEFNIEQYR